MKRTLRALAFVCLFSVGAFSQTAIPVTGNINFLTGSAVTAGAYFQFTLKSFNGNPVRVIPLRWVDTKPIIARPDSGGNISVSLQGNDALTSYTLNDTYYNVEVYDGGQKIYGCPMKITGAGPFNLNSQSCLTLNPPSGVLPNFWVPIAGGTMTGPLILSGDPTDALGAATKEYVDSHAGGGGGGSGLPSLPTSPNGVSFQISSTPSGGLAGAAGWSWPGIGGRVFNSGTTDFIFATDRSSFTIYNASTNVVVGVPDAGTTNFSNNMTVPVINTGAGTLTLNRTTTSTINGGTSVTGFPHSSCTLNSLDNANWLWRCVPLLAADGSIPLIAAFLPPAGVAAGSELDSTVANGPPAYKLKAQLNAKDFGVTCGGVVDDTVNMQAAVTAACTFSTTPKTLILPNGCSVKLTNTLTFTHCGGLTFDGGQSQGQTSLSGATGGPATFVWYGSTGLPVITINQTRDATFKRFSVFTNASAPASNGAINGILIDEIAPVVGIVTNNNFEDVQVYNGNSNPAFVGINICPTAPGNCEAQNFHRLFLNCATAAPTSSNNGIGIQYGVAGGTAEPFYEYIHWIESKHCSQDIVAQSSTAILDIDGGLMDLSYTNLFLNGTQQISYRHIRSENPTAPIVIGTAGSSPNHDLTIEENQFAGQPNSTTTISYPFATTGGIVRLIKNQWDGNATVTPMGPSGGGGFVGTIDSQDNTYPNATLCPAFTGTGSSSFIGFNDGPSNGVCPYGGIQLAGNSGHIFTSGLLNAVVIPPVKVTLTGGTPIVSNACSTTTVAAPGVSLASGFTVNNGGAGYVLGDVLQLTSSGGGSPAGGNVKVTAVSGGVITQVVTTAVIPGTAGTNIATILGTGTGATLDTVSDNVVFNFIGASSGITGYPSLTVRGYPGANNLNFEVCNPTSASITPGTAVLNARVPR